MTGFGEAHSRTDELAVGVEVRTINSRYFKLTLRCGEGYSSLEPQIESVVRQQIKRGTVQVSLRVERAYSPDDFRLNAEVLAGYRDQLESLRKNWSEREPLSIASLLSLPGVVQGGETGPATLEKEWPVIEQTLSAAMANMAHMRTREGAAMQKDLQQNCQTIAEELGGVAQRAPLVVESYRQRLTDRISKVLEEHNVSLQPGDLVREIAIFGERSDISEEVVRLRSHLDQYGTIMGHSESSGRKLDFLTQEMFREANTIGSKSNDVEISRRVIEIKSAIERMREMIQNVE
jgi:uncharacterized protein (TIGR00255 family)